MSIIATTLGTSSWASRSSTGTSPCFPLMGGRAGRPPYDTLKEALDAGTVTVAEVSEGGSVPRLALENRGERPVLVIDGEELVGAKQNRVLNLTILAPAGKSIVIPVSCVEQGRWNYRSRHFEDHDRVLFSKARAAKAARVSECKACRGGNEADQGEVWERHLRQDGGDAGGVPLDGDGGHLHPERPAPGGVRGGGPPARGAGGGRLRHQRQDRDLELFAFADTLRRLLPKLVRGCAIDAIEEYRDAVPAPPRSEVEALLRAGGRARRRPRSPRWGWGRTCASRPPGSRAGRCVRTARCSTSAPFNMPGEENRQPADDGGTIRRRRPGRRPPVI